MEELVDSGVNKVLVSKVGMTEVVASAVAGTDVSDGGNATELVVVEASAAAEAAAAAKAEETRASSIEEVVAVGSE
ncbi:unnamed protein product [Ambrosiozyma monospora]|uniref:Unnamed protein product n=1 Tax=Ambrosiozyma monospora TaxID=43982 RepID=A0ACB5TSB7_AMBMO|nr:unnamed protein product [Ambrosiozyma monospora]